jgi:hypothetical protein
MLIRGSSRLIAAVVTGIKTFTARDLATVDLVSWQAQSFSSDREAYTQGKTEYIQSIMQKARCNS